MNFIAFRDTILRLEKLVNLIVVTSSRIVFQHEKYGKGGATQ